MSSLESLLELLLKSQQRIDFLITFSLPVESFTSTNLHEGESIIFVLSKVFKSNSPYNKFNLLHKKIIRKDFKISMPIFT